MLAGMLRWPRQPLPPRWRWTLQSSRQSVTREVTTMRHATVPVKSRGALVYSIAESLLPHHSNRGALADLLPLVLLRAAL